MTIKQKYGTKELEKDYGAVTFAKLLNTYRITAELTQTEFGKKLGGLSRRVICDYENGRRIPSPAKAGEMARALGEIQSYWVQIAIQDYLRQYNLNYTVSLAEVSG